MTATAVWVMMVFTTHGFIQPTLTFKTQDQCLAAIADIRVQLREQGKVYKDLKHHWFSATCVSVEGAQ
jgi:hypothetical protein